MNLNVRNLKVVYRTESGDKAALDCVDLDLPPGRITGLIGESGSGKTTLGKALMGLLPENSLASGNVNYGGLQLIGMDEAALNELRWSEIAMVFQNGAENLNPVHRILDQVAEPLRLRRGIRGQEAFKLAEEALANVGIEPNLGKRFPHMLSGGQIQRVLLVMAMILNPKVLILDEPTAALDALTKMSVGRLIGQFAENGKRILLITHDLDFAKTLSNDLYVLYSGHVMETMPGSELFSGPLHPYTVGLGRSYPSIDSVKDLGGIRGDPLYVFHKKDVKPSPGAVGNPFPGELNQLITKGCLFEPRCVQAVAACCQSSVPLIAVGDHAVRCIRRGVVSILELRGVSKRYGDITALEEVDMDVKAGEVFCLVGETGSGKTTLGLIAGGFLSPDTGSRIFSGPDIDESSAGIAMIYQSPAEAVSHRFTIFDIVAEPLRIRQSNLSGAELKQRVKSVLSDVRLPVVDEFLQLYPHELNMGAIQRVCIARALIQRPMLLIADEPTSSLDPSVQAKVVKLLLELQVERGMTMIFITHDIGLARKIADRIGVMYCGRFVELGPTVDIVNRPSHQYTKLLLNSVKEVGG